MQARSGDGGLLNQLGRLAVQVEQLAALAALAALGRVALLLLRHHRLERLGEGGGALLQLTQQPAPRPPLAPQPAR